MCRTVDFLSLVTDTDSKLPIHGGLIDYFVSNLYDWKVLVLGRMLTVNPIAMLCHH